MLCRDAVAFFRQMLFDESDRALRRENVEIAPTNLFIRGAGIRLSRCFEIEIHRRALPARWRERICAEKDIDSRAEQRHARFIREAGEGFAAVQPRGFVEIRLYLLRFAAAHLGLVMVACIRETRKVRHSPVN